MVLRCEKSYTYNMRQEHSLDRRLLLELLADVGSRLNDEVEVTLVGGSAGMLTAELPTTRTTVDCDDQLRVPSRNADLDQVQSALRFLDAVAGGMP